VLNPLGEDGGLRLVQLQDSEDHRRRVGIVSAFRRWLMAVAVALAKRFRTRQVNDPDGSIVAVMAQHPAGTPVQGGKEAATRPPVGR